MPKLPLRLSPCMAGMASSARPTPAELPSALGSTAATAPSVTSVFTGSCVVGRTTGGTVTASAVALDAACVNT